MKNLSLLVREATSPAQWRTEVERTASTLGMWEQADREVAWYAVGTVLESIAVLAYELRNQEEEFAVALTHWISRERTRLHERRDLISDESEPAFDRIVLTVLGDIVERLDEVARSYETIALSRSTLTRLNPPMLSEGQRAVANEVAADLRRATDKVRSLQAATRGSNLEWEIYLNLIEGACRHFEEMASNDFEQLDVAA
jgi:hypothetical protein